ncbi:hypothetical protein F5Y19DRAFT_474415 [Xylariaceae sp. FL1651]|nr:hypothetical protein F5Y19DRAFT_474415 [Xylariaceae sp. FL1651]
MAMASYSRHLVKNPSPLTSTSNLSHTQTHLPPNHERPQDHNPPLPAPEDAYVLTLQTDPAHQARMSELRARYFPPHLLKVNAHITLFHALPGSLFSVVVSDLASLSSSIPPFHIRAAKPFRMARGVGVSVSGLETAERVFRELQTRWWDSLSQQDRRKFRGHYTLMNKADDEDTVGGCLRELRREIGGCEGMAIGLSLWRYEGGWWQHERDFGFLGASS